MKKFLSLFVILLLGSKLTAQTNEPVRLVLISEMDILPLKFDSEAGQLPLASLAKKIDPVPSASPAVWMRFVGDTLYISQKNITNIWTIPALEIKTAIAAQKNILQAQNAQRHLENPTNGLRTTPQSPPTQ